MVDVITQIIIDKPVEELAAYAANPDNAPQWYANIESAEWLGPKEIKPGSQVAFVAHFMGRKLSYTYEIVAWVPGRKMVMRTAEGPFPMETTYEWSEINEVKSKMTLRNTGFPKGFSKIFAPFMSKMMRRANKKDLNKIKRIIEGS